MSSKCGTLVQEPTEANIDTHSQILKVVAKRLELGLEGFYLHILLYTKLAQIT